MNSTRPQARTGTGCVLVAAVLVIFLTFFAVPPPTSESQDTSPATSTPTRILSSTSIPSWHQVTLKELGYNDQVLSGPWGYTEFTFQLPADWLVQDGSYLDLEVEFTSTEIKFAGGSLGQMAVSLDNKPLLMHLFDQATTGPMTLRVPLPADLFTQPGDWHKIGLTLDTRVLCGVPHSAQLTVYARSGLTLYYTLAPLVPDLAAFPRPFYQRSFTPESVRFVLPEQPTGEELRDAAIVAARLGDLTGNRVAISTTTDVEWLALARRSMPPAEHLIVIGQPGRNRLIPWLDEKGVLPLAVERRALALSLTGPVNATAGQTLSYTITVTNTDEMSSSPIDVEYSFGPYAQFSACAPQCRVQERRVVWTLDPLSAGQVAEMTVELEVGHSQLVTDRPIELEGMAVLTNQTSDMLNVCSFNTTISSTEETVSWATQIAQGEYFLIKDGQAVVPDDGVLMEMASPWDAQKAILIVTGDTPEAVFKAAQALGTRNSVPRVEGPIALVRQINPDQVSLSVDRSTRFTFADLGYSDQIIYNPYPYSQEVNFWFNVPLNWRVDNRAILELYFSHSEAIQENSALSVSLGRTPLMTIALDKSNAQDGIARIPLPISNGLRGQRIRIAVQASMYLDKDVCQDVDLKQAWIKISSSSWVDLGNLTLPTVELDLKYLPFPFNERDDLGNVTFVLPAVPGPADRDALLSLVAAIGNVVGKDGIKPNVVLGLVPEELQSRHHLIVIGRPTTNPLLTELNPFLPQPFLPGTDSIEPRIGNVVFRLPDDLSLGLIQELPSPWNPERAILVIAGTDDQGVLWAVQAVARQGWALKGNLALVQSKTQGLDIQALDTRRLTSSGVAAAVATAVPSLTPVPSPTPQATGIGVSPTPTSVFTPARTGLPLWVIAFAGSAILVSVIILGVALWRLKK